MRKQNANVVDLEKPITGKVRRITDLANGVYDVPIPCVNEIDDDPFPTVQFIRRNVHGKGVPPIKEVEDFVSGCNCIGQCKDINSCDCCELIDKAAPYYEGTILLNVGKAIYECNSRCSCDENCPNRVIQKGPRHNLEVFKTKDKGWGVRALEEIPRGSFVAEYLGEIIPNKDATKRGITYDKKGLSYLFDLDYIDANPVYSIDAFHMGNIGRFFNHSCDPNLVNYQHFIHHHEGRLPGVAFFAKNKIVVGEELTFDYKYKPTNKKKKCYCGSKNCRKVLY